MTFLRDNRDERAELVSGWCLDKEAAQVVLGHAKADVTQVYAERDQSLAERVARAIG